MEYYFGYQKNETTILVVMEQFTFIVSYVRKGITKLINNSHGFLQKNFKIQKILIKFQLFFIEFCKKFNDFEIEFFISYIVNKFFFILNKLRMLLKNNADISYFKPLQFEEVLSNTFFFTKIKKNITLKKQQYVNYFNVIFLKIKINHFEVQKLRYKIKTNKILSSFIINFYKKINFFLMLEIVLNSQLATNFFFKKIMHLNTLPQAKISNIGLRLQNSNTNNDILQNFEYKSLLKKPKELVMQKSIKYINKGYPINKYCTLVNFRVLKRIKFLTILASDEQSLFLLF